MSEQRISKKQIRYIQTIRRLKGIDDETYTEMKRCVGVESTTELTWRQFDELLGRIGEGETRGALTPALSQGERGKGKETSQGKRGGKSSHATWKPLHKSARKSGLEWRPPVEKEAMVRKIEAILSELKLPWSYADGMARKMFGVDRFVWCNGDQTYKVLQALTVYQQRRRA
jgi:hypothetical protein